jgi:hypothetical protein
MIWFPAILPVTAVLLVHMKSEGEYSAGGHIPISASDRMLFYRTLIDSKGF